MTDITNWDYYYKVCYNLKTPVTTNLLYTPRINPTRNIMCMVWDEKEPYQIENIRLTKELIDFFFERELTHLELFQKFVWAPKLLDVDKKERRIFIEWSGETFNNIITDSTRNLDKEYPDWQEQIFNILKDIVSNGYYKMALYPHCFFADENNQVKTFDFYSCLLAKERYIARKNIEGLIGDQSGGRFDHATVDDKIDFEIFFKNTLKEHLGNTWINNPFPRFYKELFPND